jgi:hypothetical protein
MVSDVVVAVSAAPVEGALVAPAECVFTTWPSSDVEGQVGNGPVCDLGLVPEVQQLPILRQEMPVTLQSLMYSRTLRLA